MLKGFVAAVRDGVRSEDEPLELVNCYKHNIINHNSQQLYRREVRACKLSLIWQFSVSMQTGLPERRLHCHVKLPLCGTGSVRCYLIAIDLGQLWAEKKKQMARTSNCSPQPKEDNSESLSDCPETPKKQDIKGEAGNSVDSGRVSKK